MANEKYICIVNEQILDMLVDNMLSELEARNTTPCIAYACRKILKKHHDANIVVIPSDALVINTSEYQLLPSKTLSYTSGKNTSLLSVLSQAAMKQGMAISMQRRHGQRLYQNQRLSCCR